MEKIIKIEEVENIDGMDGYKITTDKQEILVLIDNFQSCCEQWGYMSSEDSHNQFINSNLLNINLVDIALNNKKFDDEIGYGLDEGEVQFVNFETDKGTFQLAVYNAHNGYYGHSILIKSNQINLESSL